MTRLFLTVLVLTCAQTALSKSVDKKVCETDICKAAAKDVSSKMDIKTDPCEDFFQYACGGHEANAVIPKDKDAVGSFPDMYENDLKLKKDLLTGPATVEKKYSYEQKIRKFYESCMDTKKIDDMGVTSYSNKERNDWPTINSQWDSKGFKLQNIVEKYLPDLFSVLFTLKIHKDRTGPIPYDRMGIFQIEGIQPTGLIAYYAEFAKYFGADNATAYQDAQDILNMLRGFGGLMIFGVKVSDPGIVYNSYTLGKMNKDFKYLDWISLFKAIYKSMPGVTISKDTVVNVQNVRYMTGMEDVLRRAGPRTVMNWFAYRYASLKYRDANPSLRRLLFEYKKAFTGIQEPEPRWKTCVENINAIFDTGITKIASVKSYTKETKETIEKMIDNVKAALFNSLKNLDWMTEATKAKALEKLGKIVTKTAAWNENWNDQTIDSFYTDFKITGDFTEDRYFNIKQERITKFKNAGKPEELWKFSLPMTLNNVIAFYPTVENYHFLPFLQPPMYTPNYPNYLNYGGLGYFIGHEILHHFDPFGRLFDSNGNATDWWQKEDETKYNERAKCYSDVYSTYRVERINKNVNGKNGVGEILADNGGIKQAYKAYLKFDKENKEPTINVDCLNNKQLFFLSVAQTWCIKATDQHLLNYHNIGPHPVYSERVNGLMKNNPDFAKVFACKKDQPMNPSKKCSAF